MRFLHCVIVAVFLTQGMDLVARRSVYPEPTHQGVCACPLCSEAWEFSLPGGERVLSIKHAVD